MVEVEKYRFIGDIHEGGNVFEFFHNEERNTLVMKKNGQNYLKEAPYGKIAAKFFEVLLKRQI